MFAVAFAIDRHGDIYLTGRLPLQAVTPDELDRVLGAVLTYADDSFNAILERGFASSIRREYAWRVARGEPTHNLAAFRHLIEAGGPGPGPGPEPDPSPEPDSGAEPGPGG
jgi:hypothetical protein